MQQLTRHQPVILHSPRGDPAPYKLPWRHVYTEEVADRICDEVAAGRTLERIAIEEVWAPSLRQMHYWMNEHADFQSAYEFARRLRAEKLAEETLDVAYSPVLDPEDKKIIIAAHHWLVAKMNPREWGDRKIVDQNITANVTTVGQIDVSHLSLEQIHAAEAALCNIIEGEVVREEED